MVTLYHHKVENISIVVRISTDKILIISGYLKTAIDTAGREDSKDGTDDHVELKYRCMGKISSNH
jgi:hypothetical protein